MQIPEAPAQQYHGVLLKQPPTPWKRLEICIRFYKTELIAICTNPWGTLVIVPNLSFAPALSLDRPLSVLPATSDFWSPSCHSTLEAS
uniref:Uncharacterized protein n=1 Tax=Setaria italica TaxID=4555 RepID=K4AHA2_SETIT